MSKVFRKVRQKLLSEGNTGKYLKYALGEVLLIVLGILIAFQINKRYEAAKINTKMDRLFDLVKADLEHGIQEGNAVLAYYKKKDSLASLVLEGKATEELYYSASGIRYLSTTMNNYYFRSGAYEGLMLNADYIEPRYDSLVLALNHIHGYLLQLTNEVTLRFDNYTYEIEALWCSKYDWCQYYLDRDLRPEILDYFLHSAEYKNLVLRYQGHVRQMRLSAEEYQKHARWCLGEIERLKD